MLPKKSKKDMILVMWKGNSSENYDGKEHYVPSDLLLDKSKNSKIGDLVFIKWAGKKIWTGILKDRVGKDSELGKRKNGSKKNKVFSTVEKTHLKRESKESEKRGRKQDTKGKIMCVGHKLISQQDRDKAKRILFSPTKKCNPAVHMDTTPPELEKSHPTTSKKKTPTQCESEIRSKSVA